MEKKKTFDIGQRIYELRTERNLSQEQLALRSDISPTYLGLIERNLKNPTLKVIEQLCHTLDVSLAEFFSDTNTKKAELDMYSLQILAQINPCSADEKRLILRILKYILLLKGEKG